MVTGSQSGAALRVIEHFTCIHKHSCAVLKCVAGVAHRDMQHFSTISLWIRRSRLGGHGVRKCVAGVALRAIEHFTSVFTHPLGYHSHPFTSTLWGAKMRGRRGTSSHAAFYTISPHDGRCLKLVTILARFSFFYSPRVAGAAFRTNRT